MHVYLAISRVFRLRFSFSFFEQDFHYYLSRLLETRELIGDMMQKQTNRDDNSFAKLLAGRDIKTDTSILSV